MKNINTDTNFDVLYTSCTLCPRQCKVNRNKGEVGFCKETNAIRVAYAGLHNGEEPPLTGEKGSGAVFFSGCTLQCFFCQNHQISTAKTGTIISHDLLVDIFLELQKKGAANINLITGTHFAPGIIKAVAVARKKGLELPIVWNSSGFDTVATLKLLLDTVDIFLPDIKTLDPDTAKRIFSRADYPEQAQAGLEFLADNVPTLFVKDAMRKGIIMRHLVLPGAPETTYQVLSWFKARLSGKTLLSLMFQYTPNIIARQSPDTPPAFTRQLNQKEYAAVFDFLETLEIEDGFIQELDPEDSSWSPDFNQPNPFSSSLSRPVWNKTWCELPDE